MKILMVNKFLYPRGGSESYMLALAESFRKLGHEVEFFGMEDERNTVGNSIGAYTQNMDFHGSGLSRFLYPFRILYSFEAKRKMIDVIRAFKPDVVHLNNINFQLTPSIIDGAKKCGVPVVQTVHDYQMICPNHLLYDFSANTPCEKCTGGNYGGCVRQKCIHGSLVKSILGVFEAVLYRIKKTYKTVDLFICPSRFLEGKLLGARDFYRGKTKTIHNFIDKDRFSAQAEAEDYILYVGRLSREKGIENLAHTARLLPQYTFKVAGFGPDEHLLDGAENVERLGFVGGDDLVNLMARAKLLLLPSVCFENCPLTILEAHCLGVPVVTMNSGGMAELVRDGETGRLVPTPTPEAIAETLRDVMEGEGYDALRASCRAERERILSVDPYAEEIIREYEKLIRR